MPLNSVTDNIQSAFGGERLERFRKVLGGLNAATLTLVSLVSARIHPKIEEIYHAANAPVPGNIATIIYVTKYSQIFFFLGVMFLVFLLPKPSFNRLPIVVFLGGAWLFEMLAILGFVFSSYLLIFSLPDLVT